MQQAWISLLSVHLAAHSSTLLRLLLKFVFTDAIGTVSPNVAVELTAHMHHDVWTEAADPLVEER